MVNILPIASGKGGVGKSAVSVNVAVSLAQKGKKVILCDFDFGGANLHTLLGLKNNQAGMGNFIYRQIADLDSLLQETGIENLQFIAGDCLFPGTANMDFFMKKKIMKDLTTLPADYVILDLGGGSNYNTLDFFLLTYNSLLVTSPEITSIMNAYSFLKGAIFRFFTHQFPNKSEERAYIHDFIKSVATGTESSFIALMENSSPLPLRFFMDNAISLHRSLIRSRSPNRYMIPAVIFACSSVRLPDENSSAK